jgi:hypothetical protein
VIEDTWPISAMDGKPTCPWKWNQFLYLVDAESGESVTFTTHTAGGGIAIRDLTQQIKSMRQMQRGALPIVELQSVQFATKFGKKPSAFQNRELEIAWRRRSGADQL